MRRRVLCLALAGVGLGCELVAGIEERIPSDTTSTGAQGGDGGCDSVEPGVLYVDPNALGMELGSADCPLHTLTRALDMRNANTTPLTIVLADGKYESPFETLPFIVPANVTLKGAGEDVTILRGLGIVPPGLGDFTDVMQATVVLRPGNQGMLSRIEGLTVNPSGAVSNSVGVWCDSGNSPAFGVAPPEPSAEVERVRVEAGYDYSVVVTNSTEPEVSGCNLLMTESHVIGSTFRGFWVRAAGGPAGGPDGTANAIVRDTTFEDITRLDYTAIAVDVWDASNQVIVQNNTFEGNDAAIGLSYHSQDAKEQSYIEGNTIVSGHRHGIVVSCCAEVQSIVGNEIHNVRAPAGETFRGVGLMLDAPNPGVNPLVVKMRGNDIHDNDIGIQLASGLLLDAWAGASDFGTAADPGCNRIQNNSRNSVEPGYDLLISVGSEPNLTLRFAGNLWDAAQPVPVLIDDAVDGSDVVVADLAGPTIDADTSGASGCNR